MQIQAFGRLFLSALAIGGLTPFVSAAVITDPSLVQGTGAIDPAGAQAVDTNATPVPVSTLASQASLESRPDFFAVQAFAGFTSPAGNGTSVVNTISFTPSYNPDIQFTLSGDTDGTGSPISGMTPDDRAVTSAGGGVSLLGQSSAGTITYVVDFGSYDTGTTVFDPLANSVDAAAFTISNIRLNVSVQAVFRTDAGVILSTQTVAGASTDTGDTGGGAGGFSGLDGYFAFDSDGINRIGSITITRTATSLGTVDIGFDDLGFAAIPEPGSLSLIALGSLMLIRRRCR